MDDEEDCKECNLASAVGVTLNICKSLGDDKKCDELHADLNDGKITPRELLGKVKEMAEGNGEAAELLSEVESFVDETEKS